MEDHFRGRSAHSWIDRRNTTLTFYWFVATPICRSCHQIKGIIEKVDTFNNICNNKEKEKRKSSFMYNDWKLKLQKNHRGSKSFARLKTEENWKRAHCRARARVSLFLTNLSKPLQKPTDAEDSYEKVEVNLSRHVINIILQKFLINFIAKEKFSQSNIIKIKLFWST